MKGFELNEPRTLPEALALLAPDDPGVRVIAGGTALMLLMKSRLYQPARLISLRKLQGELRGARPGADGAWRVGALTTLAEIEYHAEFAGAFPVIHRAMPALSNIRIRNVATVGGHLAHGDPHMDLPPILLTLDARVRAVSPRGERWIAVADLFVGYYETALSRDELIAELAIPALPPGARCAYAKFTALSADDWPAVGVAVNCRVEQGLVREARIAVSAATEKPGRIASAERLLIGSAPSAQTFSLAADAAADAVEPLADLRGSAEYKREMIRVHVRRALEQAIESPPEKEA